MKLELVIPHDLTPDVISELRASGLRVRNKCIIRGSKKRLEQTKKELGGAIFEINN